MRRRRDQLLQIEAEIIATGIGLRAKGIDAFHGFQLAKELRDASGARALTSHGSLYKALTRMANLGLLASAWEDPRVAADASRPRRRLYRITPLGEARLQAFRAPAGTRLRLADAR